MSWAGWLTEHHWVTLAGSMVILAGGLFLLFTRSTRA